MSEHCRCGRHLIQVCEGCRNTVDACTCEIEMPLSDVMLISTLNDLKQQVFDRPTKLNEP
jgi:hypothetical protein